MTASDSTILHELLTLTKNSNDRDSRIENKVNVLDTRMKNIEDHAVKQDERIDKLTEVISNQKVIEHSTSELAASVEKLSARVSTLEKKTGDIALSAWKKIVAISASVIITAAITYLLGKIRIGD